MIADRVTLRTEPIITNANPGVDRPTRTLPSLPHVQWLSGAIRYLEGGREHFVELVWGAVLEHHPHATRWWMVYADLTTAERHRVSFDDICLAAGIKPSQLLSEILSAEMERGTDVAQLTAAVLHPQLVRQMGKSAKRIGGEYAEIALKDRHAMLQARGFLPVPKGASIHVHANASANAQAASAVVADPSVPSFVDTMQALTAPRQTVQRQLGAADRDIAAVDADLIPDAEPIAYPPKK